jgi:hypothetical protein
MNEHPSVNVLEELFEDAWQAADLAATSDDRHLVPRLLEIAYDVLVWRNRQSSGAARAPATADMPCQSPAPPCDEAIPDGRLHHMEALVAQQRAVVSKVEQRGCKSSTDAAYDLLSAMETAVVLARRVAARRRRLPPSHHG